MWTVIEVHFDWFILISFFSNRISGSSGWSSWEGSIAGVFVLFVTIEAITTAVDVSIFATVAGGADSTAEDDTTAASTEAPAAGTAASTANEAATTTNTAAVPDGASAPHAAKAAVPAAGTAASIATDVALPSIAAADTNTAAANLKGE